MNQLVKNQHVFPAKSISRFHDSKGTVEVNLITHKKLIRLDSRNNIFCVKRVWDQRAEQGYGLQIEDRFQSLVEYHLKNPRLYLLPFENQIVSEFYALWQFRSTIDSFEGVHISRETDEPSKELPSEEKLNAELKHVIYENPDGSIPIHFQRGLAMQIAINHFISRHKNLSWVLCKSMGLEFIVTDNPGGDTTIPITPNFCYMANHIKNYLTNDEVRLINLSAIFRTKNYYFDRDLQHCI